MLVHNFNLDEKHLHQVYSIADAFKAVNTDIDEDGSANYGLILVEQRFASFGDSKLIKNVHEHLSLYTRAKPKLVLVGATDDEHVHKNICRIKRPLDMV